MLILRSIFLVSLLTLSGIAHTEENEQPWRHPDVLKAAIDIRMNAEQRPQFQSAISEMLQGYGSDVRKLMRKHNQTNLPKKIAKKRKVRVKSMDQAMATFLTQEQMPAYAIYRDTLLEKMDERAAERRR